MDAIATLFREARQKRDKTIRIAQIEYRVAVQELRSLQRKLKGEMRGRPRGMYRRPIKNLDDSCHGMTVAATVATILAEGKPLTLVELTVEVQRRGVRSTDDPHAVCHAIRGALCYPGRSYRRDARMRWSLGS